MKKLILIVLALFISSGMVFSQKIKRYQSKSGKIEYKWEGKIKGTTILYWDDYGDKETRKESTAMKILGMTTKSEKTSVTKSEWLYEWEKGKKTGTKVENPYLKYLKENPNISYEELGRRTIEDLGYEKVGTETVFGKKCEVWAGIGKVWIWNSIALKSEINMGFRAVQTVTSIDLNAKVPANVFDIPADVTFEEAVLEIPVENDTDRKKMEEAIEEMPKDNTKETEENVNDNEEIPDMREVIKSAKGLLRKSLKKNNSEK